MIERMFPTLSDEIVESAESGLGTSGGIPPAAVAAVTADPYSTLELFEGDEMVAFVEGAITWEVDDEIANWFCGPPLVF
jgi:hypothetical protein